MIQALYNRTKPWLGLSAFLALLLACGQDPSFRERKATSGTDDAISNGIDDPGNPAGSPEGVGTEDDLVLPGEGANEWTPEWAGGETEGDLEGDDNGPPNGQNAGAGGNPDGSTGGNNGPGGQTEPLPEIPGASRDDLSALHRCLAKWRSHPFTGTVYNYRRIAASVSVGGAGNLINDTERTAEPFLILVDAGVNVFGSPKYNLMNPNGYYCIKVNVNVATELTVNLHCNARLADQVVNVNVGSNQSDTTSTVGVHVLSNVQINTVRPEGDTCIR